MKFNLTHDEIQLLSNKGIEAAGDYTDEEALDILDQVRDVEISYAQFSNITEKTLYFRYGDLADKMQSQIPE